MVRLLEWEDTRKIYLTTSLKAVTFLFLLEKFTATCYQ